MENIPTSLKYCCVTRYNTCICDRGMLFFDQSEDFELLCAFKLDFRLFLSAISLQNPTLGSNCRDE